MPRSSKPEGIEQVLGRVVPRADADVVIDELPILRRGAIQHPHGVLGKYHHGAAGLITHLNEHAGDVATSADLASTLDHLEVVWVADCRMDQRRADGEEQVVGMHLCIFRLGTAGHTSHRDRRVGVAIELETVIHPVGAIGVFSASLGKEVADAEGAASAGRPGDCHLRTGQVDRPACESGSAGREVTASNAADHQVALGRVCCWITFSDCHTLDRGSDTALREHVASNREITGTIKADGVTKRDTDPSCRAGPVNHPRGATSVVAEGIGNVLEVEHTADRARAGNRVDVRPVDVGRSRLDDGVVAQGKLGVIAGRLPDRASTNVDRAGHEGARERGDGLGQADKLAEWIDVANRALHVAEAADRSDRRYWFARVHRHVKRDELGLARRRATVMALVAGDAVVAADRQAGKVDAIAQAARRQRVGRGQLVITAGQCDGIVLGLRQVLRAHAQHSGGPTIISGVWSSVMRSMISL